MLYSFIGQCLFLRVSGLRHQGARAAGGGSRALGRSARSMPRTCTRCHVQRRARVSMRPPHTHTTAPPPPPQELPRAHAPGREPRQVPAGTQVGQVLHQREPHGHLGQPLDHAGGRARTCASTWSHSACACSARQQHLPVHSRGGPRAGVLPGAAGRRCACVLYAGAALCRVCMCAHLCARARARPQVPDFLNAKIGGLPAMNVIRDMA